MLVLMVKTRCEVLGGITVNDSIAQALSQSASTMWIVVVLALVLLLGESYATVANCASATTQSQCFAAFVSDTVNQCGWNAGSNQCVDCAALTTDTACQVANEGACILNSANGTCSSNGFPPSFYLTESQCLSTKGTYGLQRLVWNASTNTCHTCSSLDISDCPFSFCVHFFVGSDMYCIAPRTWCPNITSSEYCQTWWFGSCFWRGTEDGGVCASCEDLQDEASCSAAPLNGCLWNPMLALCEGNRDHVPAPPSTCSEAVSQSQCLAVQMAFDAVQCGWDNLSSSCIDCAPYDASTCRAFPLGGPCSYNEAAETCSSSGFPASLYTSAEQCSSPKAMDNNFGRLVWDTTSASPQCQPCASLSPWSNVTCPTLKCEVTVYPSACVSLSESCATHVSVGDCASASRDGCFWCNTTGLCRWCGSIPDESSCAPLSSSTCSWDSLNLICTAPQATTPPTTPSPTAGNASAMTTNQDRLAAGAVAAIAVSGTLGLAALAAVVVLVVVPYLRSGRNMVHEFPDDLGDDDGNAAAVVELELKGGAASGSGTSLPRETPGTLRPEDRRSSADMDVPSAVVLVNEIAETNSSHSVPLTAGNVTLQSLTASEAPRFGTTQLSLPASEGRATIQSVVSAGSTLTHSSSSRDPVGSASRSSSSSNIVQLQQEGAVQRVKLIGRGSFGNVYSCLLPDGSMVAMKEVVVPGAENLDPSSAAAGTTALINEVNIVSSLVHPNIVRFYGALTEPRSGNVLIFMELVSGGSLGGMIRGMSSPLQEAAAKVYARQIVSALAFIHRNGVVHRDLKCDNILMTTDGTLKLSDFGASKVVAAASSGATMSAHANAMASRGAATMVGTPYFIAPEILLSGAEDEDDGQQGGGGDLRTSEEGGGYGRRADVWSLGVLLCEMMDCGRIPWPSFPNVAVALMHIASPKAVPIIPAHISADARDLITLCCQRDPSKRPTSESLLSHPWLAL